MTPIEFKHNICCGYAEQSTSTVWKVLLSFQQVPRDLEKQLKKARNLDEVESGRFADRTEDLRGSAELSTHTARPLILLSVLVGAAWSD